MTKTPAPLFEIGDVVLYSGIRVEVTARSTAPGGSVWSYDVKLAQERTTVIDRDRWYGLVEWRLKPTTR